MDSAINPKTERDTRHCGNINTSGGIRKGLLEEVTFDLGFDDHVGVCLEERGEKHYSFKRNSDG